MHITGYNTDHLSVVRRNVVLPVSSHMTATTVTMLSDPVTLTASRAKICRRKLRLHWGESILCLLLLRHQQLKLPPLAWITDFFILLLTYAKRLQPYQLSINNCTCVIFNIDKSVQTRRHSEFEPTPYCC